MELHVLDKHVRHNSLSHRGPASSQKVSVVYEFPIVPLRLTKFMEAAPAPLRGVGVRIPAYKDNYFLCPPFRHRWESWCYICVFPSAVEKTA